VSEFVEECRREWKRLSVPDPVANEMAADLAADLAEAASEGASAEEVLGNSAFDPRSFAASWAAERGVVPPRPSIVPPRASSDTLVRRPPVVAAVVTIAVVALIGAALAILAVTAGPSHAVSIITARPHDTLPATPPAVPMHAEVSGLDSRRIGWMLLLLGGVSIIPSILLWSSWARTRPPIAPA
jgi:hypothetical protein